MQLDQTAVIFSVFFVSMLQAVFFLTQYKLGRRFGGALHWMISHLATGIGLLLYASRDLGGDKFFSVVCANAFLIVGGFTFTLGILHFLGVRPNRILFIILGFVYMIPFIYFTFIYDDARLRSVLSSTVLCVLIFIASGTLLKRCPPSIRDTGRFLGWTILIFALSHVMRIIMTIANVTLPGFITPEQFEPGAFFALMAFSMLWTYGVTIMFNQRLTAESREAEEHFRQIFELSPDPSMISKADDGTVVNVNREYLIQTGYKREELIGKSILDIGYWSNTSDREQVIRQIIATGSCDKKELEFIRKDRSRFNALFSGRLIQLNGVDHLVSVAHDITERIRMERILFNEKELLKTTLLSIGDGVISTDTEGRVGLMNAVAEELTGWKVSEAAGLPFSSIFRLVNEKTGEECENPVQLALDTQGRVGIAYESLLISRDGTRRAVQDSASPIHDRDGKITGVVIVFRDFTEEKNQAENIKYLSYHDQLTGLYNRRFFREELTKMDAAEYLPLTLVMADINGLKMANDAFGHRLGDQIITATAELLRNGFRKDDIICRIGGDEFVAILPNTDTATAEKVVGRIYARMAGMKVESVILSVSFGWQTKTVATDTIGDIFKNAEDRMYRHKLSESRSTRNRTLNVILHTLYEKNVYEKLHAERVSGICADIGTAMHLPEDSVSELRTVGLLHDIGKIAVDDTVLNATGALGVKERHELERHPEAGYRILNSIEELSQTALYVMSHHENWDGSGYPKGLKGDAIPLFSRIVAVAEAYDEMSNDRPYRKALRREMIEEELRKSVGTRYDGEVVRVFLDEVLGKKHS